LRPTSARALSPFTTLFRSGFGLCEPCVDDQIEFAVDLQCVYILLLEVDANPSCPEHSDMVQAVHCITGEAGNGFRDDIVDFPRRSEEHTSELQSRLDLVCR